MIFDLDETPKAKAATLETLSIDELYARIEALKAEIVLTEAEIARKKASAAAAHAFFKS